MSEPCALCSGPPTGRYNERHHCCRVRALRAEIPLRREGLLASFRKRYGEAVAEAAATALRGGQRAAT